MEERKSTIESIMYLLFWWLILPINFFINKSKSKSKDKNSYNNIICECEYNESKVSIKQYKSKSLMTKTEKYFFDIIEEHFSENYRIIPQVPLSSIINKHKEFDNQYQNELYRTIDIGIFNKETFEPLLMIEINDKTHSQADRYQRDLKVRKILNDADIRLLTFYTGMPNRVKYIVDTVSDYLKY